MDQPVGCRCDSAHLHALCGDGLDGTTPNRHANPKAAIAPMQRSAIPPSMVGIVLVILLPQATV